jgi:hypothetical protein
MEPTKSGLVYSREFISKMMANDYSKIVNKIDEVKIGKKLSITITPNVYCDFEERFSEATDPFCILFKENKANTIVFYNNKDNGFIRYCGDDLCYGQYTEGAELSEGQFEILFEKPEQNKYDKIEIALGLYNVEESKMNISFSKNCVTEFIIVFWTEGKQFCYIFENTINIKSNFVSILSLTKINEQWSLSVDLKDYENTKDFVNKNFDNLQMNASH